MAKYRVIVQGKTHDEIYDDYAVAIEAALGLCSTIADAYEKEVEGLYDEDDFSHDLGISWDIETVEA